MTDRRACVALDREDPLRGFRRRFALPKGVIYLDGNSLGPLPRKAVSRGRQVLEAEWGVGLIRSWNQAQWFTLPQRLGAKVARLLGVCEDEVVVTDSTSLNAFKALAAALRIQREDHPGKKIILSERDNFPTDLYMIQGLIQWLDQGYELRLVDEDIAEALDADVAVALLSHVNYRTGAMHDMAKVTRKAHRAGALVIWDLAHSAGATPTPLVDADFAIGCTYKYLNGGPGSPAYLWVPARLQDRFGQPLSGWWSHEQPFEMSPEFRPAAGIRRALCGTQPILSLAVAECGLDIALDADPGLVRTKSLALTDLFIRLVEERCLGLELITPRDHARRGSHVSFVHTHGYEVMQALIERGVIGDYREPGVLRFGVTPLYLGYADIWDAVETLRDILERGSWKARRYARRGAVT